MNCGTPSVQERELSYAIGLVGVVLIRDITFRESSIWCNSFGSWTLRLYHFTQCPNYADCTKRAPYELCDMRMARFAPATTSSQSTVCRTKARLTGAFLRACANSCRGPVIRWLAVLQPGLAAFPSPRGEERRESATATVCCSSNSLHSYCRGER